MKKLRKEIFIFNKPALNYTRNKWAELIKSLPDGRYLITIEDAGKRSGNQNAYYWGVVVECVYNGLRDAGFDTVRNKEDAHEIMKALFLKVYEEKAGIKVERVKSTSELSKELFSEFIENISIWASDYLNIQIPLPNQQLDFYDT